QRIMDGHYPRRDEDKDTSVRDSWRESANHYSTQVKSSKDPLMKLVTDLAGGAGDLGDRVRRGFGGFTNSAPRPPGGPQSPGPSDSQGDDAPPRDDR
ncbi:peptidase M48, partial [Streptomyces sp. NPDC093509]